MGSYPTSPRAAFLLWCQEHGPVFTTNAAAIGLTAPQATAFTGAVTALNNAILAQEAAKQAYNVATDNVNSALADLKQAAGDSVRSIRAFAEVSPKPNAVYALAQISPPGNPTPAPPPAKPTDLSVTLEGATGNLNLSWKAANPTGTSGTSYIIKRRLPGESQFSFVGVSGTKKFTDSTFTAGPDSVQYTVQGQRADSSGPVSEVFTISFGQGPTFQATVTTGDMKLAA